MDDDGIEEGLPGPGIGTGTPGPFDASREVRPIVEPDDRAPGVALRGTHFDRDGLLENIFAVTEEEAVAHPGIRDLRFATKPSKVCLQSRYLTATGVFQIFGLVGSAGYVSVADSGDSQLKDPCGRRGQRRRRIQVSIAQGEWRELHMTVKQLRVNVIFIADAVQPLGGGVASEEKDRRVRG